MQGQHLTSLEHHTYHMASDVDHQKQAHFRPPPSYTHPQRRRQRNCTSPQSSVDQSTAHPTRRFHPVAVTGDPPYYEDYGTRASSNSTQTDLSQNDQASSHLVVTPEHEQRVEGVHKHKHTKHHQSRPVRVHATSDKSTDALPRYKSAARSRTLRRRASKKPIVTKLNSWSSTGETVSSLSNASFDRMFLVDARSTDHATMDAAASSRPTPRTSSDTNSHTSTANKPDRNIFHLFRCTNQYYSCHSQDADESRGSDDEDDEDVKHTSVTGSSKQPQMSNKENNTKREVTGTVIRDMKSAPHCPPFDNVTVRSDTISDASTITSPAFDERAQPKAGIGIPSSSDILMDDEYVNLASQNGRNEFHQPSTRLKRNTKLPKKTMVRDDVAAHAVHQVGQVTSQTDIGKTRGALAANTVNNINSILNYMDGTSNELNISRSETSGYLPPLTNNVVPVEDDLPFGHAREASRNARNATNYQSLAELRVPADAPSRNAMDPTMMEHERDKSKSISWWDGSSSDYMNNLPRSPNYPSAAHGRDGVPDNTPKPRRPVRLIIENDENIVDIIAASISRSCQQLCAA